MVDALDVVQMTTTKQLARIVFANQKVSTPRRLARRHLGRLRQFELVRRFEDPARDRRFGPPGYAHVPSAAGLWLVGHEVKHILDDRFGAELYRPVDVMTAKPRKEYAADYFPTCLLMPRIWVERYWKQNN